MIEPLTPSKLERARAAREVATALSLYLSGKIPRAPYLDVRLHHSSRAVSD